MLIRNLILFILDKQSEGGYLRHTDTLLGISLAKKVYRPQHMQIYRNKNVHEHCTVTVHINIADRIKGIDFISTFNNILLSKIEKK